MFDFIRKGNQLWYQSKVHIWFCINR